MEEEEEEGAEEAAAAEVVEEVAEVSLHLLGALSTFFTNKLF